MELPHQPHRALRTEGSSSKATHDFLSLYKDSALLQFGSDGRSSTSSAQGIEAYPKTQDFLQPLEIIRKTSITSDELLPEINPTRKVSRSDNLLTGGIGTYTITHIEGFARGIVGKSSTDHAQDYCAAKEEHSTDSSKTGINLSYKDHEANNIGLSRKRSYGVGAFSLWHDSVNVVTNGPTRDESAERPSARDTAEKNGFWNCGESPFYGNSFGRMLVDAPPLAPLSCGQKARNNKGLVMEIKKAIKGGSEEEEDEDDEYLERRRDSKAESSSLKGEVVVKADNTCNDQGVTTPRSKHSATEQRRRSKINDRFQILRGLVPHSDQKRDKASFLLEVIEYIQSLQEKVRKYETSFQEWNDRVKMMTWKVGQCPGDSSIDYFQAPKDSSPFALGTKFDESLPSIAAISTSKSPKTALLENMNSSTHKEKENSFSFFEKSVSSVPLAASICSPFVKDSIHEIPQRHLPDVAKVATQSHCPPQYPQRPYSIDQPFKSGAAQLTRNGQDELVIEDGVINVSTAYSREILSTLSQALESAGIDLSQASISVQITLGKRGSLPAVATPAKQDQKDPYLNNRISTSLRPGSSGGISDSEHARKRPKTERENCN